MSADMVRTITSLDQLGEDGEVSRENVNSINLWVQAYSTSNGFGKRALLSEIPSEWQGTPATLSWMTCDVRSVTGLVAAILISQKIRRIRWWTQAVPKVANWFSFFVDADAQRQEARAAMVEEFRYLKTHNPESFAGKDADDINKKSDAQRQHPIP